MKSRVTQFSVVVLIALLLAWLLSPILTSTSEKSAFVPSGSNHMALSTDTSSHVRQSTSIVVNQASITHNQPHVAATTTATRIVPAVDATHIARNRTFSITGRILIEGELPSERPLPLENWCAKAFEEANPGELPTTRFYVSAEGGLGDVLVTLMGIEPHSLPEGIPPHSLQAVGCQFEPYVSACRVGQPIEFSNRDPGLHSFIAAPRIDGNEPFTLAQIPGAIGEERTFSKAEEFLRIKSDTHPWMFAYINIMDHPFFDVSDPDGEYIIQGLPPGQYQLKARHRKIGEIIQEIEISEKDITVDFSFSLE